MSESESTAGMGRWMIAAACVLFLAVGTWFFNGVLEHRRNPNQDIKTRVTGGEREVVLESNSRGHFVTSGSINGKPVTFLIDTGASDVSIPASVADRVGLERGREVQYSTANGMVTGYLTELDRVSVGGVAVSDIRGSINPHVNYDQVLLGNSFLKHVDYSKRNEQFIIRQAVSR